MASQKHQIKNKPSGARACVGSRDLVPVSRGGSNQRGMASSGKLQSQSRSSTSAQLVERVQKSTTNISSSKQIVERVGCSSRGSQTTTKISSSKQIVERVSCSSSRGSQKTTTKISSSKQTEKRVTANATHTRTHVKEEEMIRREHGSVVIDVRICAEMQKKNYVSSKGVELKLKLKH